jgi:TyrR family helix-turn-helix protein
VITTEGKVIDPKALPFQKPSGQNLPEAETDEWDHEAGSLQQALEQVERRWLKRASRQYKTTYEMAEYLGISQSSVVRKLKKYGIHK